MSTSPSFPVFPFGALFSALSSICTLFYRILFAISSLIVDFEPLKNWAEAHYLIVANTYD
jgi:hypothetical protein